MLLLTWVVWSTLMWWLEKPWRPPKKKKTKKIIGKCLLGVVDGGGERLSAHNPHIWESETGSHLV